jgi:hypothetical protein
MEEVLGICKECRAASKVDKSPYCKDCDEKLRGKAAADQKRKAEAWQVEFDREQAAKKRKCDAECSAIKHYYPVTRNCDKCKTAKTTALASYCAQHQDAIDAMAEKLLSQV